MPGSENYSFRFNYEIIGRENVTQITKDIVEQAKQAKIAKEQAELWGKVLTVAAREAGVSVKELTAQIKANARAQEQASKDVAEYKRLEERARQANIKAAEQEAVAMKRAAAEARKAAEESLAQARAAINNFLGGGSGGAGGSGGGGGGGGAAGGLLGRIGGRIGGAEVGRAVGIPGGGFIGSQIAYSLGISGGAAGGLLAGAGGLYAGFEIAKQIEETSKWAQEMRNLSREFGVTAGQMATFTQVADVLGVNIKGSVRSISELGTELEKGGSRSKEIRIALSELGLGTETAFKPAAEAVKDIVDALSKISDEGSRSRLAVDLLKEAGRDLAVTIKEMPELKDKLAVSDDSVEKVARMRDYINEISTKGIAVDALSFVFGGLLQTPRAPGSSPLALPFGATPNRPLDTSSGILQLGNGTLGEFTSPAARKAAADEFIRSYKQGHGTPEDIFKSTMGDIGLQRGKLEKNFRGEGNLTVSQDEYTRQTAALDRRETDAAEARRAAEEAIRKRREYNDLLKQPIESGKEAGQIMLRIIKDFPGFPVPGWLYNMAIGGAEDQARSELGKLANPVTGSIFKQAEGESIRLSRERFAGGREARALQDQVVLGGVSSLTQDISGSGAISGAAGGAGTAFAAGGSTYGMTQSQIQSLELSRNLSAIQSQSGIQINTLQGRRNAALAGANQLPSGDAKVKLEQEAENALVEIKVKEIDAITRSIDAINKFNESVDKVAEQMRHEFASGATSLVMGAQSGGGRGILSALRGQGEKLEGQLLQNLFGHLYGDPQKGTGAAGGLGKIGGALPPWLTQGTILGKVDPRKDTSELMNQANDIAKSSNRLLGGIFNLLGGKDYSPVGAVGTGGGEYSPIGGDGASASPWVGGAGAAASIAGPLAGLGQAHSPAQALGAVSRALKTLSSVASGVQYASDPLAAITGEYHAPGVGHHLSTGERVGAAAAMVGAGIAAYEGISTIAKGGAKNVAGGIGGTLGAIAPFTGPAAPFVAAAASVAGLVAAFLPDQRTVRANEISKNIFTHQYQAPEAQHLNASGNGGFADTDIYGNVRTSHFSPYPIVADPYLDVPRRTVVPGGTVSTFGGFQNVTGAQRPSVPTPIVVQVQTLDSRSFNDNAHLVAGAVHHALMNGDATGMVHTLKQNIGLS